MARLLNRLNVRQVQTLRGEKLHADGGGLYLDTKKNGRRWVFLYRWQGRLREMALGPARAISLATARELAAHAREQVALGQSPIEVRKAEREKAKLAEAQLAIAAAASELTFAKFADEVISGIEGGWKNAKHRSQWRRSLNQHAASLAEIPICDIDTDDVLAVLEPIWMKIPETASRVRGRIEHILGAAMAKGHRSRDRTNPATWSGHLEFLLPKRRRLTRGHHPAMPYADVPAFLVELRARRAVAARALEMLVLGTSRSGEIFGAKASEFDLGERQWIVPGERMKAGVDHTVVLTPRMIEILHEMQIGSLGPNEFVFPGHKPGRPLSGMAMEMLLRRMNLDAFTVHGFRSSFKDWAINETEFPDEISEEALAHTIGSKVRRAYRRGEALERRRRLMTAWHDYCHSGGDAVIELREAA